MAASDISSVAQVTKLYNRTIDMSNILPAQLVGEDGGKKLFSPGADCGAMVSSLGSPSTSGFSPVSSSSAFRKFDTSTPATSENMKDLSAQLLMSPNHALFKSSKALSSFSSTHSSSSPLETTNRSDSFTTYDRPQLNLFPLMQQWSMAAARHAALIKSTTSPYFPYGLLPPPTPNSLLPSPFNTSPPVVDRFSSLTSANDAIPTLGMPTRRPSNPFKPPPLKKYKCDECGKAFSRSNTLVTHKRIHTGEKPFKCESCGRAFRQPGNLTRHKLTHTTVKPYVCPTCNKAFNRASNLHTHMRTHANFRPFICHLCGKSFQQKIDLKVHFYTHTGLFPVPNTM